jgi:fatty-acyl-CoA synthase
MWSAEVKAAMLDHAPHLTLRDGMGASEGSMALSISRKGETAETAKFRLNPGVKVLDDDDQPVEPGSGQVGRVALRGGPIGYYKDPEKSARTFRLHDGVRHSFPGDLATVEADGTITLLGRGSQVINTGGEKVFAEEVEETVKRHPAIDDCLVVGVPDQRFGERVIAVASGPGAAEDDVLAHCRSHLAGYKVPRHIVFVDAVPRAPNGKADYKAARAIAQDEGVNR